MLQFRLNFQDFIYFREDGKMGAKKVYILLVRYTLPKLIRNILLIQVIHTSFIISKVEIYFHIERLCLPLIIMAMSTEIYELI